jgi:ribosomal protein S18 acetylase RimI-like enzyme
LGVSNWSWKRDLWFYQSEIKKQLWQRNIKMSIENKENQPEIKIVSATPEDVRGVAEVFYKTWLATYPNEEIGITTEDIEDRYKEAFTEVGLAKRAERIAHPAENTSFFIAKDGDKVIGVCNVMRHPDKNQLQAIYVLPEYQGKGVGAMLWEEAQRHFDLDKDTIVQVATYNTNAINFYKKLGFEETDKRWEDEKFKMKSGAMIPEMEMIIRAKKEQST